MNTNKKTKIIATIGPSSDSPELIQRLIKFGVNVFRFNMKHNTIDWHLERIGRVHKIADEMQINIGILIDLQGPEIRINTNNQEINLQDNENFILTCTNTNDFKLENYKVIYLDNKDVTRSLDVNDSFSIDDGFFNFRVVSKISSDAIIAESLQSCTIKHRKSLNLVGIDIPLPSLIHEDLEKLDMAKKAKVDFIALSFTRSKNDLEILKKEMNDRKLNCKIVSKIESQAGVDNIDEVIKNSDSIMIARGDLGVEINMEKLPFLQKELIKKCRDANKPVIVATQMLQSMIDYPIPTRAEAADVANAIFDETDAIMLSAETATGSYPVKAVQFMTKTAEYNESKIDDVDELDKYSHNVSSGFIPSSKDQTHAIAKSAISMLEKDSGIKVSKILVFTESGYTARVFSSFRPKIPIIALSENENTVESLTLSYGVTPFLGQFPEETYSYENLFLDLKKKNILEDNELVIVVHGKRWQDKGKTNA